MLFLASCIHGWNLMKDLRPWTAKPSESIFLFSHSPLFPVSSWLAFYSRWSPNATDFYQARPRRHVGALHTVYDLYHNWISMVSFSGKWQLGLNSLFYFVCSEDEWIVLALIPKVMLVVHYVLNLKRCESKMADTDTEYFYTWQQDLSGTLWL